MPEALRKQNLVTLPITSQELGRGAFLPPPTKIGLSNSPTTIGLKAVYVWYCESDAFLASFIPKKKTEHRNSSKSMEHHCKKIMAAVTLGGLSRCFLSKQRAYNTVVRDRSSCSHTTLLQRFVLGARVFKKP